MTAGRVRPRLTALDGGGDRIQTDGHLPVVDVRRIPAPAEQADTTTDSRDRRPVQTVVGTGIALLRAVGYLVTAGVLLSRSDPAAVLVGVLVAATVIDVGLALAVFAGRNWARLALMGACALTTPSPRTTRSWWAGCGGWVRWVDRSISMIS